MVMPAAVPLFEQSIVNPKVGGFIKPNPYLSLSQYRYAPTAMDTNSLVSAGPMTPGSSFSQDQVLADVINRVSGWIDRVVFGTSESAKGASLCASQSVEDGMFLVMRGFYNLQCEYWPILQLDGAVLGANPSCAQAVSQQIAQQSVFGKRTIYLPALSPSYISQGPGLAINTRGPNGKTYAAWTYTSGYAHLVLAESASEGDPSIVVEPNGPSGTLLGVYPGTPLSMEDWDNSEPINVESVSGTTINLDSPLSYSHILPEAPDFTPVTALPGDVIQAAIFMTTALIKTRGDFSITLMGIEEAKEVMPTADAVTQDVAYAMHLLEPFRAVSKQRS